MSEHPLAIAGAGLACPVGLRRAPALAAIRAGIRRFGSPEERPEVTACRLSTLPDSAPRQERMLALLDHALDEVFASGPDRWPEEIPLFLALPSPESGTAINEGAIVERVRARLSAATGAQLHAPPTARLREDRAGTFTALHHAATFLPRSGFSLALVVAVDSLVDPDTLRSLSRALLLLEPGNLDGRIPSEGAAALLVALPTVLPRSQALARIEAVETDHDPTSFLDVHRGTSINRGHGLARLFRRLTPAFPGRADLVVASQPGEGYWGRELSYAYLRNAALMPEPFDHLVTGVEVGDAGAAAGAIALHRALAELSPPWRAPGPPKRSALVYGVSDDGRMGALALFPPRA